MTNKSLSDFAMTNDDQDTNEEQPMTSGLDESDDDLDDEETMFDPLADDSCPWCGYSSEQFRTAPNGKTGCLNCEAVIPVKERWYLAGMKMSY